MKEKIFKKGNMRRLFSVVLALTMVITLMPMNSMKVYAATNISVTIDTVDEDGSSDVTFPRSPASGPITIQGAAIGELKDNYVDSDGLYCDIDDYGSSTITISNSTGHNINKVYMTIGYSVNDQILSVNNGTLDKTTGGAGEVITIDNINNSSVTITPTVYGGNIQFNQFTVYYDTCTLGDKIDGQAETCTEDGWNDYYQCTDVTCGKIFASTDTTGTSYATLDAWKVSEAGKIAMLGHSWGYNASDATLTATCTRNSAHTATLTLSASSENYSGIENLEAFNAATEKTIAESDVKLYEVDTENATTGGTEYTSAIYNGRPTEKGNYYASLTVGDATAVKAFKTTNKVWTAVDGETIDFSQLNVGDILSSYNSESNNYKITSDSSFTMFYKISPNAECFFSTDDADAEGFTKYTVPSDGVNPSTEYTVIGDPRHTHDWKYSATGNKLEAYCANAGCPSDTDATHKVSLTLSVTSANYSGNPVTVCTDGTNADAVIKYNLSDWTAAGAGEITVKYVGRDGTAYDESTTPPTKVGKYTVKIYPSGETQSDDNTAVADFTINKVAIDSVSFTEPTVVAAGTPATATELAINENAYYTGAISWSPADASFGYNKDYTAKVTLTAKENYEFSTEVSTPEGWTKDASSTDTSLVLTKTYEKTAKAKLTSVTAPTVTSPLTAYTNEEAQLNELPSSVVVEVEDGSKTSMEIAWALKADTTYTNASEGTNTFVWNIKNTELADYDVADGVETTGEVNIVNPKCEVEKVDGQAATCTADGWKDYYKCKVDGCGRYYEDETMTTVIADLDVWKVGNGKVPAIGHDFEYTSDAANSKIIATCKNDNTHKHEVALTANDATYSATEAYTTTVSKDGFEAGTGSTVGDVKIYKVETAGATTGGVEQTELTGLQVGNYYAQITVVYGQGDDDKVSVAKTFKISTAIIDSVQFTEPEQPVAAATAPTAVTVPTGANYEGTVSWEPQTVEGKYGYNTVYKATVTITAKDNYEFSDAVTAPEGWTKETSSTSTSLVFTKTYGATAKAKITNVTAPNVTKELTEFTTKDAQLASLATQASSVAVVVEDGSKTSMAITWALKEGTTYTRASGATNTFVWTITPSEYANYDVNNKPTTGEVVIKNPVHVHAWTYTTDENVITATCKKDICGDVATGTVEKLTLTANDAVYSKDQTYAATISPDTFATKTGSTIKGIEIFKVEAAGATTGGEKQTNLKGLVVGNYYAKVTVGYGDASEISAVKAFKISPAVINAATFTEPEVKAAGTPATTVVVPAGSNYAGTVAWNPSIEKFAYNTAYTAEVTITANDNYVFADDIAAPTGWGKSANSNKTKIVFVKTYDKTAKAKITSVTAPSVATQLVVVPSMENQIASLPKTVKVTVEDETKTAMAVTWTVKMGTQYTMLQGFANTFVWTINESEYANYDTNKMKLSGEVTINNPKHTHSYNKKEWVKDATKHWHAASCIHTTEKADEANHIWSKGVCTVCAYECTHNGADSGYCEICGKKLDVAVMPTIVTQPQDAVVLTGKDATFTVEATVTGGGTLSYQWYVNKNDEKGFVAIADATKNTYTVAETIKTQSGYMYYCVVKNTKGDEEEVKQSETATLTVNDPEAAVPEVTKEPTDVTIFEFEDAVFEVEATVADGGTLSYQWQVDKNDGMGFVAITGATEKTYKVSAAELGMNGYKYYCSIKNTKGVKEATKQSGAAVLTVKEKDAEIPTITKQPASVTIDTGADATFTVKATKEDYGTLSYQWFVDKNDGKGFVAIEGATEDTYKVTKAPYEMNGFKYYCVVNNKKVEKEASKQSETATLTVKKPPVAPVTVSYHTHIQSYGDAQGNKTNGAVAGTIGESKRLESINLSVSGNDKLGIAYTTHVQSIGWLPWSSDNELSGTTGESKRLEAIKIILKGEDADKYDVYYRVHAQTYGWLAWAKNGEVSGTSGMSKRLEAIQVVVVEKGKAIDQNLGGIKSNSSSAYLIGSTKPAEPVKYQEEVPNVLYRTHVQTVGWQNWMNNGAMAGTTGMSKRLEGINIKLTNCPYSGGIQYKTHIQTYGWEKDWKSNGAMSGTSGQSKRLEGIQIQLTGEMAKHYDVYYRVHAQTYGWLAWAKNGESAGTAGQSKRLEGIQIVLVKKGGKAPANNYGGITSKESKAFLQK